jgi:hypothetical protein
VYSHVRDTICNLLNRVLPEIPGFTAAINLSNCFCKVNIFLLLDQLPQKLFHTSL